MDIARYYSQGMKGAQSWLKKPRDNTHSMESARLALGKGLGKQSLAPRSGNFWREEIVISLSMRSTIYSNTGVALH